MSESKPPHFPITRTGKSHGCHVVPAIPVALFATAPIGLGVLDFGIAAQLLERRFERLARDRRLELEHVYSFGDPPRRSRHETGARGERVDLVGGRLELLE